MATAYELVPSDMLQGLLAQNRRASQLPQTIDQKLLDSSYTAMQKLANMKTKHSRQATIMQKYNAQLRNLRMFKQNIENRPIKVAIENLEAVLRKNMERKKSELVETAISNAPAIAQPNNVAKPLEEVERLNHIVENAPQNGDLPVQDVEEVQNDENEDNIVVFQNAVLPDITNQNQIELPKPASPKKKTPSPKKNKYAKKNSPKKTSPTSIPRKLSEESTESDGSNDSERNRINFQTPENTPKFAIITDSDAKRALRNNEINDDDKRNIAAQLLIKFINKSPKKFGVDVEKNIILKKDSTPYAKSDLHKSCETIMANNLGLNTAGIPSAGTEELSKRLTTYPGFDKFIEEHRPSSRRVRAKSREDIKTPGAPKKIQESTGGYLSYLLGGKGQVGSGRKRNANGIIVSQSKTESPFRAERWHHFKL